MVIPSDEPDIIVGGDPPIATAVPASAAAFNNPNKNIERTTNADGSLVVKATTTTRQPNGYRNVTIEYFYVPANMVGTVIMSMDATGEPPSSLYMTKMEQQVLPPGTGEVVSHAPATAGAAGGVGGGGNAVPQPYTHQHTAVAGGRPSGGRGACIGITVFLFIAIAIIGIAGAINVSNSSNHYNWPTPAPYSWEPPSPWYPTPSWGPPTPNPTRDGCKDTPDWVDENGNDCEYYSGTEYYSLTSYRCTASWLYEGSMGSASENCCTCGGGSTYVAPTPWPSSAPIVSPPPSPRPTQSSACKDTPGWKDSLSNGCDYYSLGGFFCDFYADYYKGDMGSANDNCCACGGGKDPSTSKAPATATSNTAVPSVIPPDPAAGPTLGGKGVTTRSEKHSNLSNTNPFRSPTAAVAKED
mmetsp:Transcript_2665/g.3805  ORF Transcript_2665/g.3805 Transcript_2665/m.3805 type:complete len:412 (-) Transcript_2665:193-1428(-)